MMENVVVCGCALHMMEDVLPSVDVHYTAKSEILVR